MLARENPFATDCVLAIRYEPQEESWEQILDRLAGMNYRGAIVGPKGTGKTTLLEDLQICLASKGMATCLLRLSEEKPYFDAPEKRILSNCAEKTVILLDGAEQLHFLAWQQFRLMHKCGLIITTHRPGRLPTAVTTVTTPQLLISIIKRLAPATDLGEDIMHTLFERHNGNIRDAIRELYDRA